MFNYKYSKCTVYSILIVYTRIELVTEINFIILKLASKDLYRDSMGGIYYIGGPWGIAWPVGRAPPHLPATYLGGGGRALPSNLFYKYILVRKVYFKE